MIDRIIIAICIVVAAGAACMLLHGCATLDEEHAIGEKPCETDWECYQECLRANPHYNLTEEDCDEVF